MKNNAAYGVAADAAMPALAAIDVYQFDNEQQEQRFRMLTEELRCPKCQNQSIADSDAGIAQDMRDASAYHDPGRQKR